MVTANVDIPALKARHPLGDTVEASGVRLRGRGRVRQGVCPFHDEAEGSFTVYGDSERFYCFGCGEGGDVLDFIQRVENLSLPEAIARLDGSPGLAPRAAVRPAAARRPKSAALPPRDPALLTAAARFYAGRLRRHSEGREYLASRGVGPAAAARLGLGFAPGSGLREFMERGSERFAGMVVIPDAPGGLVRWLVGRAVDPDRTPRFQALPGPKPVLGMGRLGPAPSWTVVAEGVFDWLSLTGWGLPAVAALGTQGVERAARRRSGFRPCSDAGPPPSPFPKESATWPSLRPGPRVAPPSCASWRRRPTSPLSNGTCSRLTHPHSHHPGGPMPDSRRASPAHGFP